MKISLSFLFCLLLIFVGTNSFGTETASVKDQKSQQAYQKQLKEQLGEKRYNRLMRKIDRKQKKGSITPNDQANIAFFISLLSILFFPLAFLSLFLAANAKKRMKATDEYKGEGLATAALAISIGVLVLVAIIIGVLFVSFYTLM